MKLTYPACVYQDPETGHYTVEVPDLPGCVSGGAAGCWMRWRTAAPPPLPAPWPP